MVGLGVEELLIPIAVSGILFLIAKYLRRGKMSGDGTIEISKNMSNCFEGQIKLNGRKIDCVFDTGASATTINMEDARKIGVDTSKLLFAGSADTAVGTVSFSIAKTQVKRLTIGSITISDFPINVIRHGNTKCLLGMDFFSQLDSCEIVKDKLVLKLAPRNKTPTHNGIKEGGTHSRSSSKTKILAKCPSCSQLMTLPKDVKIRIKCPQCNLVSEANTSKIMDGYAETQIPSH